MLFSNQSANLFLFLMVCSSCFCRARPSLPTGWQKHSILPWKTFRITIHVSFLIRPDSLVSYTPTNYNLRSIVIEHFTMYEFWPGRWEWATKTRFILWKQCIANLKRKDYKQFFEGRQRFNHDMTLLIRCFGFSGQVRTQRSDVKN